MSPRNAILITGAASGIGLETARLFAQRDWLVGLFDVNEKRLAEITAELGEERACWRRLDVSSYEDCRAAVDFFATKSGGRLDVLFNCAGVMCMGLFDAVPIEEHAKTVAVNFLGVVYSTYAALDLLKKTPGARVISMCSASAFYGVPELAVYSASKFAVRGFTEALNLELERYGIWVTDLIPPYVNTPMISGQTYQAGTVKTLGAKVTSAEIAGLVWQAAHGRKVHWVHTTLLKLLTVASRLLPFLQRPTMRYLSRLPRAGERKSIS